MARAAANFALAALRDGFPPLTRPDRALDIILNSHFQFLEIRDLVSINNLFISLQLPLSGRPSRSCCRRGRGRLLAGRRPPAVGALVAVAGHRAHLDQLAVLARQAQGHLVILGGCAHI